MADTQEYDWLTRKLIEDVQRELQAQALTAPAAKIAPKFHHGMTDKHREIVTDLYDRYNRGELNFNE